MFEMREYAEAFKKGFNYVLYGSSEETREEPILDESSVESSGYYDGFQYGIYCERVGISMSISDENLIAVIDKHHWQAMKRYQEYEDKYIRYKSGFVDGKSSILLKITSEDTSFNELPEIDENDLISVGYYDGYSYFLNEYVQNGIPKEGNLVAIDEVVRSCFHKRKNSLKEEKGNIK